MKKLKDFSTDFFVTLGGWALFAFVFSLFKTAESKEPNFWKNTIFVGILMGLFNAICVQPMIKYLGQSSQKKRTEKSSEHLS